MKDFLNKKVHAYLKKDSYAANLNRSMLSGEYLVRITGTMKEYDNIMIVLDDHVVPWTSISFVEIVK